MVMKLRVFKSFIFFIIFFSQFCFASEKIFNNVKWILNPVRPIQNSSFSFTVSFNYLGSYIPQVNFELDGCELINKNKRIIKKTNKIINDKFTTIKKVEFKYIFKTRKSGNFTIRKFRIFDKKSQKNINQISFYVDKVIKKKPEYHFVGEVDKKEFFKGEGFNLNYYLYFKDYVLDTNIMKFPKLNGFFKRYKKVSEIKDEIYQFKGSVYNRRLIYSARLFPTNTGKNFIDSMELTIDIPKKDMSGFNSQLNSSRVTKLKLVSPEFDINVKQVPMFLKGPGFINLVGNHKFHFKLLQNSTLINDPVRFLLRVEGEGFLEEMDPPILYQVKGVEVFNVQTELSLSKDKSSGIKQFIYTIIGKEKVTISERKKLFSTFESSTLTIKSQEIILPSLSFLKSNLTEKEKNRTPSSTKNNIKKIIFHDNYLAPQFNPDEKFVRENNILNIVLFVILLFVIFDLLYKRQSARRKVLDENIRNILKDSKRGKLNYSRLFQLIQLLKQDDLLVGKASPREILNGCNLKLESKRYFKSLLEILENDAFGKAGAKKRFKYERKCFKDLQKNLYK